MMYGSFSTVLLVIGVFIFNSQVVRLADHEEDPKQRRCESNCTDEFDSCEGVDEDCIPRGNDTSEEIDLDFEISVQMPKTNYTIKDLIEKLDEFKCFLDSDCLNGGFCKVNETARVCVCEIGYEGVNCAIEIDKCAAKLLVCEGHPDAKCQYVEGIATCQCPEGLSLERDGKTCGGLTDYVWTEGPCNYIDGTRELHGTRTCYGLETCIDVRLETTETVSNCWNKRIQSSKSTGDTSQKLVVGPPPIGPEFGGRLTYIKGQYGGILDSITLRRLDQDDFLIGDQYPEENRHLDSCEFEIPDGVGIRMFSVSYRIFKRMRTIRRFTLEFTNGKKGYCGTNEHQVRDSRDFTKFEAPENCVLGEFRGWQDYDGSKYQYVRGLSPIWYCYTEEN